MLQTIPVDAILSSVSYADPIFAGTSRDVVRCRTGQRWTWDGVMFTVLHPPPAWYAEPRIKTNDLSCVLRIDSDHGSVLLPQLLVTACTAARLVVGQIAEVLQ